MPRHPIPLGVVLGLAITGCAARTIESAHLGPPPAIESAIRDHYARHATENAGRCPQPHISSITNVEVLEDDPEQLVVRVRYSYGDRSVQADDPGAPECDAFAGRIFTVADTPGGLEVVETSEPRR